MRSSRSGNHPSSSYQSGVAAGLHPPIESPSIPLGICWKQAHAVRNGRRRNRDARGLRGRRGLDGRDHDLHALVGVWAAAPLAARLSPDTRDVARRRATAGPQLHGRLYGDRHGAALPGGDSRGNRRGPEPLLQRQVVTGSDDQSRTVNPNSRAAFNPSTLARPASERWPMVRSIASAE